MLGLGRLGASSEGSALAGQREMRSVRLHPASTPLSRGEVTAQPEPDLSHRGSISGRGTGAVWSPGTRGQAGHGCCQSTGLSSSRPDVQAALMSRRTLAGLGMRSGHPSIL